VRVGLKVGAVARNDIEVSAIDVTDLNAVPYSIPSDIDV